MNKTLKLILLTTFVLAFIVAVGYQFIKYSINTVNNATLQSCHIETETIIEIREGSSYDIVFSDSHGDLYYINRGLQRGLNLDHLKAKVLNKSVTLHLPKLFYGTSEHIAQLAVNEEVLFTEFE